MIRVADYVINRLHEESVKHVFGITGWANLYLTDAIARHNTMQLICTHHEQAAAFAANAYAQYSGGIGVCLTSIGGAATNAITGILNAWEDEIPTIYITGNKKLKDVKCEDITAMVKSITQYSVMARNPMEIAIIMDKALYYAQSGRKPVLIDIPIDIQNSRIEPSELERWGGHD